MIYGIYKRLGQYFGISNAHFMNFTQSTTFDAAPEWKNMYSALSRTVVPTLVYKGPNMYKQVQDIIRGDL